MSIEHIQRLDQVDCIKADVSLNPEPYLKSQFRSQEIQNASYNGWLHSHFVGCIFTLVPSGIIVSCTLNAAGSWHDSYIAENSGLYAK
jgi:hypothetical protein